MLFSGLTLCIIKVELVTLKSEQICQYCAYIGYRRSKNLDILIFPIHIVNIVNAFVVYKYAILKLKM